MSLDTAFEVGRLRGPLVDIAAARRDEHSAFLLLPGLVGFWPLSSTDASGNALDHSGNLILLTKNGTITYNQTQGTSYAQFNGTDAYFSRTDRAELDVLGTESHIDVGVRGLTLGGWFQFSALGSTNVCLAKDDPTTNRSYNLRKSAGNQMSFNVTSDGSTLVSVQGGSTLSANTWYFLAGRFEPSTRIATFVNGALNAENTTSIPGSLFNSSALFTVGADHDANSKLAGRASLCFICAASLPDDTINGLYQITRDLFGV